MTYDARLLSGIGVLAAVVEGGSFVRAAEALGLSDSGVSRAVARLEARLGIRLFDRTTRSLRLTDEGARFHAEVAPLLDALEAAAAEASGAAVAVRGRLRVDVDPFFARQVLVPRLSGFLERHPRLDVEFITREKAGDLVPDGVDVALRFGHPTAASTMSRRLFETRVLTVASPAYLERHGRPATPRDLAHHRCIHFRDPMSGRPFAWKFVRDAETVDVAPRNAFMLGDVGFMLDACLAGIGIAQVLALGTEPLLADGGLVEIFCDWPGETFPLYAVHPSRHHPSAKVRSFLTFCLDAVRERDLRPSNGGLAVERSIHS